MEDRKNAAFGSFIGAACGDAVGATLEFLGRPVREQDVEGALQLPGGGCFSVGPGQFTDDTELAICLAMGLADHSPHDAPEAVLDSVAFRYGGWIRSAPFDIGNTCRAAFQPASLPSPEGCAAACRSGSASDPLFQANGALMRATPIGLWCHARPLCDAVFWAKEDAKLSHASPVCVAANAVYVAAAHHLINFPGDAEGAVDAARSQAAREGDADVSAWVREAMEPGKGPQCDTKIGWARWGLVHALRALAQKLDYEEAIRQVLLKGGDTDTNAAIVGGLVGARVGLSGIPQQLVNAVLHPVSRQGVGQPRPGWLHGSTIVPLAEKLWERGVS